MLRCGGRGRALAGAAALSLLAHAGLLGQWLGLLAPYSLLAAAVPGGTVDRAPPGSPRVGAAAVVFQVRQIAQERAVQAASLPAAATATAAARPAATTSAASRSTSPAQPALAAQAEQAEQTGQTAQTEHLAATDTAAPRAARTNSAGPAEAPAALPTYRTSPPPALDLHYEVRRGESSGAALLAWRIDDEGRYLLELSSVGGTQQRAAPASGLAPHWSSRGTLDAAGIAPERFAVSRRGRERHAANFRRDAGIVSFAGPARTWPLVAGAQDRLSWMLQLASVLQADPSLAAAGATISMMVIGAHGEAGVWTFTVSGQTPVEGPGGASMPAWHLRRESAQAHDPQVEVWVAPALHHLPVRLKLSVPRSGESTEFHLRALQAP